MLSDQETPDLPWLQLEREKLFTQEEAKLRVQHVRELFAFGDAAGNATKACGEDKLTVVSSVDGILTALPQQVSLLAPETLPPVLRPPVNPGSPPVVWLDVSRLLWRVFRGNLTGIDRVELAYAEHLLDAEGEVETHLVGFDYRGGFRLLPSARARRLVRAVRPALAAGRLSELRRQAVGLLTAGVTGVLPHPSARGRAAIYLNVSHHPLHHGGAIARLLRRTGARFVPLVHDLIPLDWPEFSPPAEVARHRRRLDTVNALADAVLTNSAATAAVLRPRLRPGLPVVAAPLGVTPVMPASGAAGLAQGRPYFLAVGTIEPRKNHLLLLHAWRRMAATGRGPTPLLLLVGRRGWENEQVLDVLERGPLAGREVRELGGLNDGELAGLMLGARALLMPSFTEGFGLPVAEALAQGVPVIASAIPAHQEVGAGVPEFLDPGDLPAWQAMIENYAAPCSPFREAQMLRLRGWAAPRWETHMRTALTLLREVAEEGPRLSAPSAPGLHLHGVS